MAESDVRTFAETTPDAGGAARLAGGAAPAGSRESFEQLVAEQQAHVARLAGRLLGWRRDVDDVVQDVFVAAYRAWSRFRGQASPRTWITRITINACRSHLRKRTLRLRLFREVRSEADDERGSPDDGLDRETFERVRSAVRGLSRKYREVVVLRYLEELPAEQIAELLGVTRNAVDVRLMRARAKLKDALEPLLER